jgi:hypothetical protein
MNIKTKLNQDVVGYNYTIYPKETIVHIRFKHGDSWLIKTQDGAMFSVHKSQLYEPTEIHQETIGRPKTS